MAVGTESPVTVVVSKLVVVAVTVVLAVVVAVAEGSVAVTVSELLKALCHVGV